jgi:hypothetical protein
MKKIAFAFLAALAVMSFAGCKKKGGTADILAKMEGFKNDMCKCKAGDKACAEKVGKDMNAYMESMKGKIPDEKNVSEADKKKSEAIGMEMMKCQQTAMGMGGDMAPPATPPAGDTAAPPATPPAGDTAAPPAGGTAPAGEMKKEEGAAPAGGEMKKEEAK